jgi:hypothetical protein
MLDKEELNKPNEKLIMGQKKKDVIRHIKGSLIITSESKSKIEPNIYKRLEFTIIACSLQASKLWLR